MRNRIGAHRESTAIFISILTACSIYASWNAARSAPAIDFYQFWVVGREVATGQPGEIFSMPAHARMGQFYLEEARRSGSRARFRVAQQRQSIDAYSTPFLYAVFSAYSSPDYDHDVSIYRISSLLFAVLSIIGLCHLLGYSLVPTLAVIPLLTTWFGPSISDLGVGNVNHLQLMWLVMFLFVSSKSRTAPGFVFGGFLLGLGAMFKPNTALIVGMLFGAWVVRREYEKLIFETAGIVGGSIAAFLWSSYAFGGIAIWRSWLLAISSLPSDAISVALGNYSPARLLNESLGVDATWAIALICMGLVSAVIFRGLSGPAVESQLHPGSNQSAFEDIHVVALAGIVMLLISPLSWFHYFVFAIPMLLIVFRPILEGPVNTMSWTISRITAIGVLLAIMMRPLVLIGLGEASDRAILRCVATAILFGFGLRGILALRDAADPSPIEAEDGHRVSHRVSE